MPGFVAAATPIFPKHAHRDTAPSAKAKHRAEGRSVTHQILLEPGHSATRGRRIGLSDGCECTTGVEQMKKFTILVHPLSMEDNKLTPTLNVKHNE